ncbi:DUF5318 family protein [Nakamurella deserti]|uniref:DUF5318 family protein n=1 Tax=Nakamurella deserti TaxID=2164074 RepID=UPI000DBE899C|nr:DUF5318 family protein [Nakamurella deserti]
MQTQRGLVDYALRRRSLLAQVTSGRVPVAEVCEASPYLMQAAKFHGVPTDVPCPVCRKENLTHVHWIYGDELGTAAGSARTPAELEKMAGVFSEFDVYMVEVCRTCQWNHLVSSFVMGHQGERAPKARRAGG